MGKISVLNEDDVEKAIISLIEEEGWQYIKGSQINRETSEPLWESELKKSLRQINPELPEEALSEAFKKLKNFENNNLISQNRLFTDYIQSGIEVTYRDCGQQRSAIVKIVDFDNAENNSFRVANQVTFAENGNTRRADVMLFLNGMPVVLMELKSCSRENVDESNAYRQIRNYMKDIPSVFIYNCMCIISDGITSKAGTITSPEDRFCAWKAADETDGRAERKKARYSTLFKGMLGKDRFLDIISNYICFSVDGQNEAKILAGYHQYFAVKKSLARTETALREQTGKIGVVWHTQGSGKSLSMVFYSHLLNKNLESPTIVVITDRNDLDGQLYKQFCCCSDFLRQQPVQAQNRKHLKELLSKQKKHGIFFTTMQKFEESCEPLSERRDIIIISDEAHRGHYNDVEKFNPETGEIRTGYAQLINESLPNAAHIGFTGTPLFGEAKNTSKVFGDFIDIYDMTQSEEDGTTCHIYFQSRVADLKLDKEKLELIDKEYEIMSESADREVIEKSKRNLASLEMIFSNDETIDTLVSDILEHYEDSRAKVLTGKAMIVAYSREIAMKMYKKILQLHPEWTDKIAIVMTENNNDPEEWRDIIGGKSRRLEVEQKFKNANSELKIVIVVDMWLTGFDVPSLATMYVFKRMKEHNLMQAITRVNRVYPNKDGGLVVDYIGIMSAVKEALKAYTSEDMANYENSDIEEYVKFFYKQLEICREIFAEYNTSGFSEMSSLEKMEIFNDALNMILDRNKEKDRERFLTAANDLRKSLQLCASVVDKKDRLEASLFESLRVQTNNLLRKGGDQKLSVKEADERISALLESSVESGNVIVLSADGSGEYSLLDVEFLREINAQKQPNLAISTLEKLLEHKIAGIKAQDKFKAEKFSKMMQENLKKYYRGLQTSEETFEYLKKIAKETCLQDKSKLGLSPEEEAFYKALTKPQASVDFYGKKNDDLVKIVKELTKILREYTTVDWKKKESVKARIRIEIFKLLKKYKYPPAAVEEAENNILEQLELRSE